MSNLEWLPELVLFNDYGGNWERYLAAIYQHFCDDFVDNKPSFQGVRLGLKRHPVIDGKEATFWHMISEGEKEADRIPNFRRCERIRWAKPVIESDGKYVKIWREPRNSENRIHLWLESASYLVVLNERNGYILPWTAYVVEREHEKAKLNKRWEKYKN
ncbi:MAG: hypothetical protein WCL34_16120 [Methylococcaceae bacterium]